MEWDKLTPEQKEEIYTKIRKEKEVEEALKTHEEYKTDALKWRAIEKDLIAGDTFRKSREESVAKMEAMLKSKLEDK